MSMFSLRIPCDIAFAASTMLSAGEVKCLYEAGNLVQIRFGDQELIRKIYGAVRLHNWETLPPEIDSEDIQHDASSFKISYNAIYGKSSPLFRAKFVIAGNADNSIRVSMEGEVLEDFSRNRIGLCVLHPVPETKGMAITITRPDEREYNGNFPVEISPHEPFLDIRSMRWTDSCGNLLSLRFEGDIFEMEDQRNWSDHSFKTYSTPHALARPVTVKKGEKIYQSVEFTAEPSSGKVPGKAAIPEKIDLPKIGYALPVDNKIDALLSTCLEKIPMDHLRIRVDPSDREWKSAFDRAVSIARDLSVKLEIILTIPDDSFLDDFIETFSSSAGIVYSILPLTAFEKFGDTYHLLKSTFPQALIGYGFDDSFANLNRNRPGNMPFDFLSFYITPQAHASDNRTIVENLFSHAEMLATANSFANGKAIHISPVTLIDRGHAKKADDRQYTSFLASWAAQIFQTLAGAGSITFFDLQGENGVLQVENGKVVRSPFYRLLEAIKEFGAVKILTSDNQPSSAIIFENASGEQLTIQTDILSKIAIRHA